MPDVTVVKYAEYLYLGGDSHEVVVPTFDPQWAADNAPSERRQFLIGFSFYALATLSATVEGKIIELSSDPINRSNRYLVDAKKLTSEEVALLPGNATIVAENMRMCQVTYMAYFPYNQRFTDCYARDMFITTTNQS